MKTAAFAAVLALSALVAPAASASVTLSATPVRVTAGQPVTVAVEIVGTGAGTFSSPQVPGLDRLSGDPAATDFTESASSLTVEGMPRTQSFSITVTPRTPGQYPLGPVAVGGESSTGVTVTVDAARGPLPAPAPNPSRPGDERVPADGLELATAGDAAQPTGIFAQWAAGARKNPLPWIAGVCAVALAWLAARTYSFLKRIEELAGPETAASETPTARATAESLPDGAPFADQAVALVRQKISAAVGRDVSHLAASELADLEPHDGKRELVRQALRLADALRFGGKSGAEDEVRRLLKEYLA